VYIVGHNTDNMIVSRLAPLLFSGNIQKINSSIKKRLSGETEINATYQNGVKMFSAIVTNSKPQKNSKLFDSAESFEDFIKEGRTSYSSSMQKNKISRVDLEEDSNIYELVDAKIKTHYLNEEWQDANLTLDSVYKAVGKALQTQKSRFGRHIPTITIEK